MVVCGRVGIAHHGAKGNKHPTANVSASENSELEL
jgi:hypothetical protein